MSCQTDETVAAGAAGAGDRHQTLGDVARLYAIEPARQKSRDGKAWCWYVEPLELLFTTWAPTCDVCGEAVLWMRPPKRTAEGWEYRISCSCGFDFLETAFPLRIYARPPG